MKKDLKYAIRITVYALIGIFDSRYAKELFDELNAEYVRKEQFRDYFPKFAKKMEDKYPDLFK